MRSRDKIEVKLVNARLKMGQNLNNEIIKRILIVVSLFGLQSYAFCNEICSEYETIKKCVQCCQLTSRPESLERIKTACEKGNLIQDPTSRSEFYAKETMRSILESGRESISGIAIALAVEPPSIFEKFCSSKVDLRSSTAICTESCKQKK